MEESKAPRPEQPSSPRGATRRVPKASTAWAACLGWVLPAASVAQPAADPTASSIRLERPWVVQPEIGFAATPPEPLPGYLYLGGSVQRALTQNLDLHVMLGKGLTASALAARPGQPEREVTFSTGLHARALLRGVLGLDARDHWAVSAGLGPMFLFWGDFGSVALARGEAALEYRSAAGFAALYAIGYDLALNDTPPPFPAVECTSSDCPNYFDAGKGQISARIALGLAF